MSQAQGLVQETLGYAHLHSSQRDPSLVVVVSLFCLFSIGARETETWLEYLPAIG